MTARPVLYSFRRCPYAMRARLAILVSGIICEIREVKLSRKPDAMIQASPKGTVPVLVLPDGQVIDESLDIMRWALGQHDPEAWLSGFDADLIATNDGPFKHHLDRYKYPERHGSDAGEHRTAAIDLLLVLEERLANQANLCGEKRSITDAALMPFIRQYAATDRAWFDDQPIPHVRQWLDRHVELALFQDAMVRMDPWQDGDPPILFPSAA